MSELQDRQEAIWLHLMSYWEKTDLPYRTEQSANVLVPVSVETLRGLKMLDALLGAGGEFEIAARLLEYCIQLLDADNWSISAARAREKHYAQLEEKGEG